MLLLHSIDRSHSEEARTSYLTCSAVRNIRTVYLFYVKIKAVGMIMQSALYRIAALSIDRDMQLGGVVCTCGMQPCVSSMVRV